MKYLLFPFVFLYLLCTGNQISGPATEEGNPVLAGVVIGPDNRPATLARISLYRKSETVDSLTPSNVAKEETMVLSDSTGNFKVEQLPSGFYVLEFESSDKNSFALINDLKILENSRITLDTVELGIPGTIMGTVTRGGVLQSNSIPDRENGFIDVYINEINRHVITDMSGKFTVTNVPSGTYTLTIYASDGFFISKLDSIFVSSADTTKIPTVYLTRIPYLPPPKPFDLTGRYDKQTGTVFLNWKAYNNAKIIGFQIERRLDPLITDTIFTSKDPFFKDTIVDIVLHSTVYYVIRSVNERFVESYNEGPVSIIIE